MSVVVSPMDSPDASALVSSRANSAALVGPEPAVRVRVGSSG
jgi:hypothetical protein